MVKAISQDYKNEANWTEANYVNDDDLMTFPFELPIPLGPTFPVPVLKICRGSRLNDFFKVGSMRIISDSFRDAVQSTNTAFEYFDVTLLNHNGVPFTERRYYFAHLLTQIDCFDFEHSEYTLDKWGNAEDIRHFRLHEHRIDSSVFLIERAFLGRWFSTEDFAARIEATALRGMIFLDLDEIKL